MRGRFRIRAVCGPGGLRAHRRRPRSFFAAGRGPLASGPAAGRPDGPHPRRARLSRLRRRPRRSPWSRATVRSRQLRGDPAVEARRRAAGGQVPAAEALRRGLAGAAAEAQAGHARRSSRLGSRPVHGDPLEVGAAEVGDGPLGRHAPIDERAHHLGEVDGTDAGRAARGLHPLGTRVRERRARQDGRVEAMAALVTRPPLDRRGPMRSGRRWEPARRPGRGRRGRCTDGPRRRRDGPGVSACRSAMGSPRWAHGASAGRSSARGRQGDEAEARGHREPGRAVPAGVVGHEHDEPIAPGARLGCEEGRRVLEAAPGRRPVDGCRKLPPGSGERRAAWSRIATGGGQPPAGRPGAARGAA